MANKYLIIGPAWVGDLIMAQSLFKFIKLREPDATLEVMVPEAYLPLLAAMPEVAKGLPLPFRHGELNLLKRRSVGKSLKGERYTQSIVLPNSWKSALIPFFAGIKRRIGWKGEARWLLLNDMRRLDKAKLPLMIQRFSALALGKREALPSVLPWPALQVHAESQEAARSKFNLDLSKPILTLCPGAEFGPAKRWPAEHFALLARARQTEGWQIWILGAKGDVAAADEIQSHLPQPALSFAGKTDLAEALALLSLSTAVVSNDSGLMHMANAMKKPTVVVYGSSSPQFTPPLSEKAEIVKLNLDCQPCFKRTCPLHHLNCLKKLPPSKVLAALNKVSS